MDDGLLLNFTSSSARAPKQKVKAKGNWRERRKAQVAARGQPIREHVPPAVTVSRKVRSSNPRTPREPIRETTKDMARGGRQEIISSLFTSNDAVTLSEKNKLENFADNKPVENAPLGDETFQKIGLPDPIIKILDKMGIVNPTKIQRAALPQLLNHERDAFVIAQTGSGKTFAYLLPIIAKLIEQPELNRTSGLFAVILAPTRELATQIFQGLEELVRCCHWIVPGIVIGGEKKKSEKARLRKGVNILVGTPGRLADHFDNTSSLDVSQIRWVVLDEGDRLVELGFEETLTKIMNKININSDLSPRFEELPERRVHVLCSATMNASVERLKTVTLDDPIWIRADNSEESAPSQLRQLYVVVPPKLRLVTLAGYLKSLSQRGKGMIFFSCADSVDFHYEALKQGLPEMEFHRLHGSLTQQQRTQTLQEFGKPSAKLSILLCTDVASRGLDIHVNTVIEYDPPFSVEDHIHRVGRTARAGQKGSALLFLLTGPEEKYVDKIDANHQGRVQQLTYQNILQKAFGTKWDIEATAWQLRVEKWILSDEGAHELAKKAFMAHVRAYTTHTSSEREYFNIKTLHLGHITKSFALRDLPSELKPKQEKKKKLKGRDAMMNVASKHMAMGDYNIA